ncbi:hypothetical protein IFM89_038979 [Coptis chinensis]|uniref:Secreted protein n=1 Tax=Coptis chinensis TaxID=261450 RepID=A0A835LP06_9MAGN|nr:hypothetical protein IFM89_038979 [Coptis chinensis]
MKSSVVSSKSYLLVTSLVFLASADRLKYSKMNSFTLKAKEGSVSGARERGAHPISRFEGKLGTRSTKGQPIEKRYYATGEEGIPTLNKGEKRGPESGSRRELGFIQLFALLVQLKGFHFSVECGGRRSLLTFQETCCNVMAIRA